MGKDLNGFITTHPQSGVHSHLHYFKLIDVKTIIVFMKSKLNIRTFLIATKIPTSMNTNTFLFKHQELS